MSFTNNVKDKLNRRKSRLSQILPTAPLIRAKRLSDAFRHHILDRTIQIPSTVDLRPDMTPVDNQLNIGSSVAHSLAGAYEYLTKKSNGYHARVSRLFIDYNAKIKNDLSKSPMDNGYSISDAIKALEIFGTCLEAMWPYDISNVNIRPSNEAYEQAESHQINKILKMNIDLHEMKSCLAQGFPFVFVLKLFSSFEKATKNGVVVIPRGWEQDQEIYDNHAMLAVGYNDRSNGFIIRNSWGEDWGDQGYCYVPYDYMTNPELCSDIWSIRKIANSSFDREYWHFDDLIDYTNETVDKNNDDEPTNWKEDSYLHRQRNANDTWEQYRHYEGNRYTRNDDDYLHERYRRERYDRDNEPFDRRTGGRADHNFYSYRHLSYPFYDPYRDENSRYEKFNDEFYHGYYHRRSIF